MEAINKFIQDMYIRYYRVLAQAVTERKLNKVLGRSDVDPDRFPLFYGKWSDF